MMSLITNGAAVLLLGILVLLRGRDPLAGGQGKGLRIAALVPLGLQAAFFLLFAIGEMAAGDLSGAGHLLQVVGAALPGYLAWLRPLEGGIVLLAASLVGLAPGFKPGEALTQVLILSAPQLLSGLLFVISALLDRKKAPR
jgi:hypothetical protein